MATLKYLSQYFSTTLNVGGGIDASQTTGIILQSVSGVTDITKPGQICITYSDPIDTSVAEWIDYTSINGSNELVGAVRGREGFSAHAHLQGATVAFVLSASHHNDVVDLLNGTEAGIKVKTAIYDDNGNEVIKTPATASAVNEVTVTNSATGNAVQVSATGGDTDISLNLVSKGAGTVQVNGTAIVSSIISTTKYAPQGFLLNGKIVPSVASNDLTVAIKGMDGNDPSASNPVYVRIGDTVRTITAALSVTKADGTNWFNAGSAELATKEVDYFVYLGYNATDGTVIGFSRIPYATLYSDFSATSTNEKYCAISTITNAAAGDNYENVGRFAATLSAGAGYTWTVPTFTTTNLIQRPIYETRWSTAVFTVSGSTGSIGTYANSVQLALYKIERDSMKVRTAQTITNVGSWTGNLRLQLPMGSSAAYAAGSQVITTGAVLTSGGLTIEGWAYQIPATGLMTFVSSFNTVVYPFSSLAVSDVITVNADYPLI